MGYPLFALEVGRTLAERGSPALGQDLPVPDTVEELLGKRVSRLPGSVRGLLLALALGGDLDWPQLTALAGPGAVEDALAVGVVVVDGDRARAAHPLLAAAARTHSDPAERRARHLEEQTRQGMPVRYVRSMYLPEDETCFLLYEAESVEAARRAAVLAAVPFERVSEVVEDNCPGTALTADNLERNMHDAST